MHTRDRMFFKWRVGNMNRWFNQLFAVQTPFDPHFSSHGWLLEIARYGGDIILERWMGDQ